MNLTGKLLIFGDVHGNLHQVMSATFSAQARGIQNTLQLGDFGAFAGSHWERYLDSIQEFYEKNNMFLHVLRGNHDDPFLLNSYTPDPDFPGALLLRPNVRFLTDNTQFKWNEKTVTIEGGAFSVDRQWRELGFDYWEEEIITDEQVQKALTLPPTDILFCHDSPTGAPNPITDNPQKQMEGAQIFGYKAIAQATQHRLLLQTITEHLQPSLIAHGHYHEYGLGVYNLSTGKETRVLSLDEGAARHFQHFITILDPDEEEALT